LHGFSGPLDLKWGFCGQSTGRGGTIVTPNKLVFTFWGSYVCAKFGENRPDMRPWECSQTDRYTHWQTDRRKLVL